MITEKKLQIQAIVPAKGTSGELGSIVGQSGLGSVGSQQLGKVAQAAEGAVGNAVKTVGSRLEKTVKTYTVQFNPSQLTLSGYGGGMYQKTDYGSASNAKKQQGNIGISYEPAKVRLMMSVTLIFDQVSVKDAFMADKFAANPTGVATGAATLAKEAITKEEYSVQPIRGEVDFSMILVDEEVGPNNMGVWKKHYEEAFGGGNVSYKKKTQSVGNIFNI